LESLEKLDDDGVLRVDWFVQAILENDPVLMSLASAPVEEEPLTEEEEQVVEESRKEMEAGEFLTHEEVRRLWLGERA
jgi:predicted transcriptional regulator